jgi:choline dehydrogenase
MCSGIGPAAHLAEMGVPVVHDAPAVGSNLHDHPMACPTFTTSGKSLKSAESLSNVLNYILARKGMLASNVAEAVAFLRSPYADGAPDLELLFAPVEWREEGLKPPRVDGFTIAVIALTPGSRGTLKLKSRDIRTAPQIDPALLSDSAGTDRLVMSFGLQLARQIANTKPLSLASGDEIEPGTSCDNWEAQQEWLNQSVQTVYHPAGTCRMGTGPDTVVSPSLAVKGVENLWIADASVMPAVTRGHPNAAVAMIAERGAEFIAAAL